MSWLCGSPVPPGTARPLYKGGNTGMKIKFYVKLHLVKLGNPRRRQQKRRTRERKRKGRSKQQGQQRSNRSRWKRWGLLLSRRCDSVGRVEIHPPSIQRGGRPSEMVGRHVPQSDCPFLLMGVPAILYSVVRLCIINSPFDNFIAGKGWLC